MERRRLPIRRITPGEEAPHQKRGVDPELVSRWRVKSLLTSHYDFVLGCVSNERAFCRCGDCLTWIIQQGSSQKRKDALKGMMNTGFADPAFPFRSIHHLIQSVLSQ